MNFAKRLLMVAGAGALAGILALAVAPKTAHALVAALVQVSNTPSSAVPVVHAPAASTVYFATCEGVFSGLSQAECSTPPVPAGRSLVIEAASIFSQTTSGADPGLTRIFTPESGVDFAISMQSQATFAGIDNYTGQLQGRLTLPAVGSSEMTPTCTALLNTGSSTGGIYCTVSGYTIPAN